MALASAGDEVAERSLRSLQVSPPYLVDSPPISVILPTLNEEEYLGNWLKSIRNQTLWADEILVVDYMSNDRTRDIAGVWGCRVIQTDKPGVGNARDLGAKYAVNDLLFFADADAVYEHRLLEECARNIEEGWDVVYVPGAYYDTQNPIVQAGRVFNRFLGGITLLSGYATMVTRDAWEAVGGWELPVGEEMYFGVKLRDGGFNILKRRDLACACSGRLWWGESRANRGEKFLEKSNLELEQF